MKKNKWALDKCLDLLEKHYPNYHSDNNVYMVLEIYKNIFD